MENSMKIIFFSSLKPSLILFPDSSGGGSDIVVPHGFSPRWPPTCYQHRHGVLHELCSWKIYLFVKFVSHYNKLLAFQQKLSTRIETCFSENQLKLVQ